MQNNVWFAVEYATRAHHGIERRHTKEPYVCHCFRVAKQVDFFGYSNTAVQAALLHDTVEDCDGKEGRMLITLEDLKRNFGPNVAELVAACTKPTLDMGNRAIRKRLFREQLIAGPEEGRVIKLFDVQDNIPSIIEHEKNFAFKFMDEARLLYDEVLKDLDKDCGGGLLRMLNEWESQHTALAKSA
jgi:(p)ppGpp synthase/HD superfamily hydrolase